MNAAPDLRIVANPDATTMRGLTERAIRNAVIRPVFQPRYSLPDLALTGAEMLARWDDPQFGSIPPDIFVPIAEASGFIRDLDQLMLNHAFAAAASARLRGTEPAPIAVNISADTLCNPALPSLIRKLTAHYPVQPGDIELELTERRPLPSLPVAAAAIRTLQNAGLNVVLDDFATEHAQIDWLLGLPIAGFKLSKQSLKTARTNPLAATLTAAIVGAARKHDLSVTAEGVETREELAAVAEWGCTAAQGYLLSRPVEMSRWTAMSDAKHVHPATAMRC